MKSIPVFMFFHVIFLPLLAAALPSGAPGLFRIYMLVFKLIQTQSETHISVRKQSHIFRLNFFTLTISWFKVQSKTHGTINKLMAQSKKQIGISIHRGILQVDRPIF